MTGFAVEAMDEGSKEVAEGSELAVRAGHALTGIQKAVANIVIQIEGMSAAAGQINSSSDAVMRAIENVSAITEQTTAAAEEMNASSSEVVGQIEAVAAVSEENAAAAEEVSSVTQEQLGAIDLLASSAAELSETAEQLQTVVSRFKLEEQTDDTTSDNAIRLVKNTKHLKAA